VAVEAAQVVEQVGGGFDEVATRLSVAAASAPGGMVWRDIGGSIRGGA
jgi:hypothetical protein